jgi:histone H3/H4
MPWCAGSDRRWSKTGTGELAEALAAMYAQLAEAAERRALSR